MGWLSGLRAGCVGADHNVSHTWDRLAGGGAEGVDRQARPGSDKGYTEGDGARGGAANEPGPAANTSPGGLGPVADGGEILVSKSLLWARTGGRVGASKSTRDWNYQRLAFRMRSCRALRMAVGALVGDPLPG